MMDIDGRIYLAPDGKFYEATLAPMERGVGSARLGVDPRLRAIVFERADGWIGSAPIYHMAVLWALTEEEVGRYWEIAVGRG